MTEFLFLGELSLYKCLNSSFHNTYYLKFKRFALSYLELNIDICKGLNTFNIS